MFVILQLAALFSIILMAVSAYLLPHIPLIWEISGGVTAVLVGVMLWTERAGMAKTLSKKTTRYGLNSLFMAIVVTAIVVTLNLIVSNHDIKKDITKNRLHSLSEQSVKVIQALTFDVRLRAFVSPMQMNEFDPLLDKYTYLSKHIKKEYVDVDKDPMSVKQNNIKQAGTILIESDARTARVDNLSPEDAKAEEKITNAIIQVAKGDKKKIYFITGHGERSLSDASREGYSEVKETLESGRYQVVETSLVDKDKIPADAELLICAGPKSDFMDHEIKLLEGYLSKGGKFLLMVEPDSTPTLKPFLTKYGVDWKYKKAILETNPLQRMAGGNPLTPIVNTYDKSNEITRDAKQLSIFPVATPVEKMAVVPAGITMATLLSTSARSLEVTLQGDKVAVNEKKDRKGPLSLALALSSKITKPEDKKEEKKQDQKPDDKSKEDEWRMVVVGDADFAANGVKRFGINADLFQNMLSWLSKEEDLISIRPKESNLSELEITEERMRVINLASIIFAPFAFFISAVSVWFTRRRK